MKGYKNSTKTVYETEESANYARGGMAKVGKVMGEFKRGTLHSGSKQGPEVTSRKQAVAIGLSEARKAGAKVPMKKAEGGSVKAKGYDPVADEPTSRPLTADQVRNIRNRMKVSPPKPAPPKTVGEGYSRMVAARRAAVKAEDAKRGYDPVRDEPTSRPFAEGGAVKSDMAQDKATVRTAVHKHERAMHPGKPLTALKKGGMAKKQMGGYLAERESAAKEMVSRRSGGKVNC